MFKKLTLAVALCWASLVNASDKVSITPFIGTGLLDFHYSAKFGNITTSNMAVKGGFIVSAHNVYATLSYLKTVYEDNDYHNALLGGASVPRSEFDVTVKYSLNPHFSAHLGYLNTDSKVTYPLDPPYNQSGFPSPYISNYKESGPYIGVGFDKIINKGVFSASLSYAILDGEITDNLAAAPLLVEGDTQGLSFGIGWTSMLTDKLGYSLSASARLYEFDGDVKTSVPSLPGIGAIDKDLFDADFFIYPVSAALFYNF